MATRHVPETRDPTASGRLDFRGATLVRPRTRRHDLRADRGAGQGDGRRGRIGGRRGRPRAGRLPARRARQPEPDDAARDVLLPAVQRGQPGHLRRLRGSRGRLLPARRVPPDLARLLADRRRRGVAAGDLADAPVLRARRGTCPADRRADPVDGGAARDRGRAAPDDADRAGRQLRRRACSRP